MGRAGRWLDVFAMGGRQQSDARGRSALAGTRLAVLHSIGVWPVVINDETVVEKSVPLEELVLHAKGRPSAEPESSCGSATFPTVAESR